jgi:glycosyltransferase involved in cell wall biosynthesis
MKTKVIAYLGPSGSKLYRAEQVFKYLNRTGEFDCIISPNFPNDKEMLWADIIFLQHTIEPRAIAEAWAYKMERGKKIVIDRDDALETTSDNPFDKRNKEGHAASWTKELIKISDLVTVTTEEIAKETKPYNRNTKVLPNFLDMELWDIETVKNESEMLRLGWVGSMTHRADLAMVMPVVKTLLIKYPKLKFVYCGDNTIAKELTDVNPVQHEYIPAIGDVHHYAAYAQKVLQFDIAIAPLVDNHFNRCKSNLKYLEYGMMKLPAVYSPAAYEASIKDGETGFLAKTPKEFYRWLSKLIESAALQYRVGRGAYLDVKNNYSMKDHAFRWAKEYKALLDTTPSRNVQLSKSDRTESRRA